MHDAHIPLNHNDMVTRVYAHEIISAFGERMQEIKHLAEEINNLLANYEADVQYKDAPDHAEALVSLAKDYSSGLLVAGKIFRNGQAGLRELSRRLNLKSEEHIERGEDQRINSVPGVKPKYFTGPARQVGKTTPPVAHIWGRFPVRSVHVGNARA